MININDNTILDKDQIESISFEFCGDYYFQVTIKTKSSLQYNIRNIKDIMKTFTENELFNINPYIKPIFFKAIKDNAKTEAKHQYSLYIRDKYSKELKTLCNLAKETDNIRIDKLNKKIYKYSKLRDKYSYFQTLFSPNYTKILQKIHHLEKIRHIDHTERKDYWKKVQEIENMCNNVEFDIQNEEYYNIYNSIKKQYQFKQEEVKEGE